MTNLIKSWIIYNPTNKLFWNNESGWGSVRTAARFHSDKPQANLPIDGVWVPYVISCPETTDELIEILQEFPKGTKLRGLDDGDSVLEVVVQPMLVDTKRHEETDDEDCGILAAIVATVQ